tara:strand:- start:655 stop:819 length:165 start_codon:yes stop_codon:yes gene_type:complete
MKNPDDIIQELVDRELSNLEWTINYHGEKLEEAKTRRDELLGTYDLSEGLNPED